MGKAAEEWTGIDGWIQIAGYIWRCLRGATSNRSDISIHKITGCAGSAASAAPCSAGFASCAVVAAPGEASGFMSGFASQDLHKE